MINAAPGESLSAADEQTVKDHLQAVVKKAFGSVAFDPDELYREAVNELQSRISLSKGKRGLKKKSLSTITLKLARERVSRQLRTCSRDIGMRSEVPGGLGMDAVEDYIATSGDEELADFFKKHMAS